MSSTLVRPAAPAVDARPPSRKRRRPDLSVVGARVAWLIVAGVFVFFFAVPILWMVLAPTRTDHDLVVGSPIAFGSWENLKTTWEHVYNFQSHAIVTWMKNSAIYGIGSTAIAVVTAIPAGYALAMMKFRARKLLLTVTLVVMLMPAATMVLPLYLEMDASGLDGTVWAVILPTAFYPFGTYLAYTYYVGSLPDELLDSARIDGANEWQTFWRIGLPLGRPVIALVMFLEFVHSWNSFFLPYVMLPSNDQAPTQVGLSTLLSASVLFNPAAGVSEVGRPEIALAALISSLPVLIVFILSQRSLVEGMTSGATKG